MTVPADQFPPEPKSRRAGAWSRVVVPFAVAGAVLLRRRGRPLLILLAPVALVTLVAIATYGVTRFRFAAEPSFVVLGAVAVDALLGRLRT